MIRILKQTLLLLFIANVFLSNGFAQNRTDFEKLLQELDHRIERLTNLLTVSGNDRALEMVLKAHNLREEAVTDAKNRRFEIAAAKLRAAFSLLDRAEDIAIKTFKGTVSRLRNRISERFTRAEQLFSHTRNREAQRLLEQAKNNFNSGERAFSAKLYERSFEHYNLALILVNKTITLAKSLSDTGDTDVLTEERRKFENLKERAATLVEHSHNALARQTYQNALTTARNALAAYNNGRKNLAKKLLDQASLLLLRAINLASTDHGASVSAVNTEDKFVRLRDFIEQSRDLIEQSDNPRTKILFNRANNILNQAQTSARAGENAEALGKFKMAENLVRRAIRIAQSNGRRNFSSNILQQIESTKNEISWAKANIQADSPADAKILLNVAELAINRAQRAANSKTNRLALESILVAQRFLTRAEKVLNEGGNGNIERKNVEQQLGQLDAALAEAENRIANFTDETWNRQLLRSARDIRNIAAESFEKGNFIAANEAVQIAFDLIRKSLRNVPRK